jgi:hypothetical protein
MEQKRPVGNSVLKGAGGEASYKTIANCCWTCIASLSGWFKRCHKTEKRLESFGLSEEEIAELSTLNWQLYMQGERSEDKYGNWLITLVVNSTKPSNNAKTLYFQNRILYNYRYRGWVAYF